MNYALPHIQKMNPYHPPLSGRRTFDGILLDFNEAVHPISPAVKKALADFVEEDKFHIYPEYDGFKELLAEYAQCNREELVITDGSDRAIDLIFRTFSTKGDEAIIPDPSFAMLFQSSELSNNTIISPNYSKNGEFPMEEVLKTINPKTKIVVICNPNNPTGTLIQKEEIEKVAKKALEHNALVLVDEAYYEFSGVTAVPLMKKYDNIIITRTFSKAFGITATRIGYAIAAKELVAEMEKVKGPYDVNMFALTAATASLKDKNSMKIYVQEVIEISKPKLEKFLEEKEINYIPSGANFILLKIKNGNEVYDILDARGIRTRPRPQKNGEVYLRVSIGTEKDTDRLIEELQKIL